MKLIKRFLQGGITSNVLLKGLTGLTLQAGLQLAKLASEILSTNSPQKNDFIKNESFVDPSAPVNYLTPAMQKGDKIPSSNGISLMAFFKHMIPGFREAYKMKLDQKQYEQIQKQKYRVRIPLLDYPILLPKLLSNNKQTSKNITRHLDGGEVLTALKGWKLSPATPYDRGLNTPNTINSVPEINVNGIDRRWRFDRRSMDLGNNRGITSEVFYDYYDGGNSYLGDYARVRGGRTIYSSPKGNDTIYFNTPTMEDGWYKHVGNMVVGSPLPGAKANFFKNLKRPLIKNQKGGLLERADNTRIQKPIPGIIPVNSEVRTYDGIPVRVKEGYPRNDEFWLGNPARPMYSPWKNIKLNGIYPSAYGVELDVLPPELMQKIDGNDTTYYVLGDNREYYPVVGYQARPQFREAFKNPKARLYKPNYFDTPEKIDKVKQVIANWNK